MFGVEEHRAAPGLQVPDRIGHHGHTLVEAGPERLGHVVGGGLADDADDLGLRRQQVGQGGVLGGIAVHTSGRTEGHQLGSLQVQLGPGTGEELHVLRVRAGPAPLDVVHAEAVQLLGYAQLVGDRERDALQLRAIAQRRVVDLHRGR